ncbi:MAG: primosomal protein N' [Limnobacter sp.]|nr:primosomal protein N' [Limnobacter sp.]
MSELSPVFPEAGEVALPVGCHVEVMVAVPLPRLFTYRWPFEQPPCFGQRVIVPWGKARRVAVVYGPAQKAGSDEYEIKPISELLDNAGYLTEHWRKLLNFAAAYYHYPLGMLALETLPKALRVLNARGEEPVMVAKAHQQALAKKRTPCATGRGGTFWETGLALNPEQTEALLAIAQGDGFRVDLLYGVTGSGKTEVYLNRIVQVLQAGCQVLVLLPEINLTPAALALYESRLKPARVVVLHSGLAEMKRTQNWFEAASGVADVVIATRLGITTPLPRLGLIVVDEEHDPSYKQQEGLKYHARDLSVVRGKQENLPVLLGSATPSLESLLRVRQGSYRMLNLTQRASKGACLPEVELVNTAHFTTTEGLAEPVQQVLKAVFETGKQSIVYLNRRGYSPQLACQSCGWVAGCEHCTSHMVWHKKNTRCAATTVGLVAGCLPNAPIAAIRT